MFIILIAVIVSQMYTYSTLTKLYVLNMRSLLYVNYISSCVLSTTFPVAVWSLHSKEIALVNWSKNTKKRSHPVTTTQLGVSGLLQVSTDPIPESFEFGYFSTFHSDDT